MILNCFDFIRKDELKQEQVQRKATRMEHNQGLESLFYERGLKEIGLLSLAK